MNSAADFRTTTQPIPPRPYGGDNAKQEWAVFSDYRLGTSPSGQYYIFNVSTDLGNVICRLDARYRPVVDDIFASLDNGRKPVVPVSRDMSGKGWRIDIQAYIRNKAQELEIASDVSSPKKEQRRRIRAQFSIEPKKLEALERLAVAEGFPSYTDWIRCVIDRTLSACKAIQEESQNG